MQKRFYDGLDRMAIDNGPVHRIERHPPINHIGQWLLTVEGIVVLLTVCAIVGLMMGDLLKELI